MWKIAIDKELKAISDNNVWKLVKKRPDMYIITSRWIFRTKDDIEGNKIYKA